MSNNNTNKRSISDKLAAPNKLPRTQAIHAPATHRSDNAQQVAEHYNQRRELGRQGRLHTKITGLRVFNNWVKSLLIQQHTWQGCRVLDLGCGKGGDLRKWSIAQIGEYVGMDIAQVSVTQAQRRYTEMNASFPARFYAQDCYGRPLELTLEPRDYQADIISAQFCLHYAFETREKALQMIQNISGHLASGGHFVCTVPNANWLVKKQRAEAGLSFGNSVYQVQFAQPLDDVSVYGCAYSFTLDEAVEDCTEYLVHLPSFIELAREHGLELVYATGFHDFFSYHINQPNGLELFGRMRVIDYQQRPAISADEWEAIGIYQALCFKKT